MKFFLFSSLISLQISLYAQSDTLYKPVSIIDLFQKFDTHLDFDKRQLIKQLTEDSLRKTERWSKGLLHGFNYSLNSNMAKDLEEKGIGANTNDYYYLLLVCYHRYLNERDIELYKELKYYEEARQKRHKEYLQTLKRDSADNKYIPSSLPDCFIELDKILSDKDKNYIRKNGTTGLHMNLGMFIRNRWQLWGGSRLKKYFIDINGGSMHPDSMSGVILQYYEDWLKGKKDTWREWEARMKQKHKSNHQ